VQQRLAHHRAHRIKHGDAIPQVALPLIRKMSG
jgi:hypothetical protein